MLGQSFGSIKLSSGISNVSCAGRGQSAWESGSQLLWEERTPFRQLSSVLRFYSISLRGLILTDANCGETLNYASFHQFINKKYIKKKVLLMQRFGDYFRTQSE